MLRLAEFDLIGALADLASGEEHAASAHISPLDAEELVALVLGLVRLD